MQLNNPALSKRQLVVGSGITMMMSASGCVSPAIVGDNRRVEPLSQELQERLFKQAVPFAAHFRRGMYSLTFVAAEHSTDPNSSTFKKIAESFTRARPLKLVIEGVGTAWGDNPEAITSMIPSRLLPNANSFARAEGVYSASLAVEAGIPFVGGEPNAAELNKALLKEGFQAEDVFFTNMLKYLNQNRMAGEFATPSGPAFARAYTNWSQQEANAAGGNAYTIDEFKAWYARTFDKSLVDDPDWAIRFYPTSDSISGKITATQMLLRDRHLHDVVITSLQSSKRVLVVYGASHLATLWAAFSATLGPPRIW
jgi:hypothetical protein